MKSLIKAIRTGYWAIEPTFAKNYHGIVEGLLNGNGLEQLKEKDPIGSAQFLGAGGFMFDDEIEEEQEKDGNINVIPVKGVVVKNDTLCETGTATMAGMIQKGEADEAVQFHLLDIDSGGGQVDGTAHLGNEIAKAKKPVIAFVNGLAASAAYWIASQADVIIANDQTTMVGSIGTMVQWSDYSGLLKAKGVKNIEIYADDSTDKNKAYSEAIKGNDKPMKETLNTLNDQFKGAVKRGRPNINQSETLTGKVFIGSEAVTMGLADQIGTMEEAIQIGFNLSNDNMFSNKENKTAFMQEVATFLGITPKVKAEEVNKNDEEMEKAELEQKISSLKEELYAKKAELEGVEASLVVETAKTVESVSDNVRLTEALEASIEQNAKSTAVIEEFKGKAPLDEEAPVQEKAPVTGETEAYKPIRREAQNPFQKN